MLAFNFSRRSVIVSAMTLILCALVAIPAYALIGDINGDGSIDKSDINVLVSHFRGQDAASDLDGSGTVDAYDLNILLSHYGQSGSANTGQKLKWSPPSLTNPTTINVPTGDTAYSVTLNNSTDYVIKLPSVSRGPVAIWGGRNVVMIGGHLHMTADSAAAGRILYINGNGSTGTTHIEGVLLDRDEGVEADDMAINAPNRTVQVENVRGMGVRGSFDGVHGDVIQPWGGVDNLLIDHLSASSNYQGLFLRPDLGHIGTIDINNVDMAYDDYAPIGGGYLIWLTTDGGGTYGETADSIKLNNVYLSRVRQASTFSHSIWPQVGAAKGAVVSNNQANWPLLPAVSGAVTYGNPPNGQYVPDGIAGTSYVSPGYQ